MLYTDIVTYIKVSFNKVSYFNNMKEISLSKLLQLAVPVAAWSGLILMLVLSISAIKERPDLAITNFVSYFTIQSNLLVAIYTTYRLFNKSKPGYWQELLQFGILVNITITGIVYALVLASTWKPEGLSFIADALLHYVTPILSVASWLLVTKKSKWSTRFVFLWLAYPIVYFIYTMVRGPLTGFYPYPFIDASVLPTGQLVINVAAVSVFFVIVGWTYVLLNNNLTKQK